VPEPGGAPTSGVPPTMLLPPVRVLPPTLLLPPVRVLPPTLLLPPVLVTPPLTVLPPPPVLVCPPLLLLPPALVTPPLMVTPPVVTLPPVLVCPPLLLLPPALVTPPVMVLPPALAEVAMPPTSEPPTLVAELPPVAVGELPLALPPALVAPPEADAPAVEPEPRPDELQPWSKVKVPARSRHRQPRARTGITFRVVVRITSSVVLTPAQHFAQRLARLVWSFGVEHATNVKSLEALSCARLPGDLPGCSSSRFHATISTMFLRAVPGKSHEHRSRPGS
jgi:hypothetical protein